VGRRFLDVTAKNRKGFQKETHAEACHLLLVTSNRSWCMVVQRERHVTATISQLADPVLSQVKHCFA
jgi:hypothetical protein